LEEEEQNFLRSLATAKKKSQNEKKGRKFY